MYLEVSISPIKKTPGGFTIKLKPQEVSLQMIQTPKMIMQFNPEIKISQLSHLS